MRGDLTEGFLRYRFGGAYIWRGLFSEFYGSQIYNYYLHFDSNLEWFHLNRFLLDNIVSACLGPAAALRPAELTAYTCKSWVALKHSLQSLIVESLLTVLQPVENCCGIPYT